MRKLHALLSSVLLVVGCGTEIHSEYDPKTDFSTERTYMFCTSSLQTEDTAQPEYDTPENRNKIKDAIISEMNDRGYRLSNDTVAILQVGFHLSFSDRERSVTRCSDDARSNYWMGCTTDIYTYTDGTLLIYISDIKKNQVVWLGKAKGILNVSQDNTDHVIKKTVEQVFEKYPVKKRLSGHALQSGIAN